MDQNTVISADGSVTDEAGEHDTDDMLDELLVEEISIDGMCGVY